MPSGFKKKPGGVNALNTNPVGRKKPMGGRVCEHDVLATIVFHVLGRNLVQDGLKKKEYF